MEQIEVTEEVKKLLDICVNQHNEMVENYPDSVAAVLGKRVYSDFIMRWYKDSTRSEPILGKEFGRLSG